MTSPARPAEIPAYLGNDEFLRGFYTHVSSEARSRQDPSTGLIPPQGAADVQRLALEYTNNHLAASGYTPAAIVQAPGHLPNGEVANFDYSTWVIRCTAISEPQTMEQVLRATAVVLHEESHLQHYTCEAIAGKQKRPNASERELRSLLTLVDGFPFSLSGLRGARSLHGTPDQMAEAARLGDEIFSSEIGAVKSAQNSDAPLLADANLTGKLEASSRFHKANRDYLEAKHMRHRTVETIEIFDSDQSAGGRRLMGDLAVMPGWVDTGLQRLRNPKMRGGSRDRSRALAAAEQSGPAVFTTNTSKCLFDLQEVINKRLMDTYQRYSDGPVMEREAHKVERHFMANYLMTSDPPVAVLPITARGRVIIAAPTPTRSVVPAASARQAAPQQAPLPAAPLPPAAPAPPAPAAPVPSTPAPQAAGEKRKAEGNTEETESTAAKRAKTVTAAMQRAQESVSTSIDNSQRTVQNGITRAISSFEGALQRIQAPAQSATPSPAKDTTNDSPEEKLRREQQHRIAMPGRPPSPPRAP
ncbi:hypothetical protein ABH937_003886 [Kitasatospora sp. GAS1066B]